MKYTYRNTVSYLGFLPPWGKAAGKWSPPPSSAEIKNEWSYTLTSHTHSWRHGDNFIFFTFTETFLYFGWSPTKKNISHFEY
jgi:hypothetical protein